MLVLSTTPHEVSTTWEPWRIAVARRVTRGDTMFMELVRGDRAREPPKFADERICYLGAPRVLAQFLEHLMRDPSNDARLRWLKEELESKQDLPTSDRRQVDLLTKRFSEEMDAMLREKMAGQIEIFVAPVNLPWRHGNSEGAIQELPQFAVTETAYFDDDDGLLRQSLNSTTAWRCYGICAKACANGTRVSVIETLVPAESKPEAPAEPQLPRTMSNILRAIVKVSKARGDILWLEASPRDRDLIVHEALFELGLKNEKRSSNQQSFARIMREFIACHWAIVRPYVEAQIADIPDKS